MKHKYQPGSKKVEYTNIWACINKSAKLEARIVKADFWRSDSNITQVKLSPLIRPSIRPRIIPDYQGFI